MEETKQDLEKIKEKLIEQIKNQYDENQANDFISKINEMNSEQFIEFLKTQGLISEENNSQGKCVFCSMVSGEIPTTKIGENGSGIAILEINPVTEGHTLIIPKSHVGKDTKLEENFLELTEEVTKKLTKAFSPTKIELIPGEILGHQVINALPIYNEENIDSPRTNKNPEELLTIKEKIENSKIEEINLPEKEEEIVEEKTEKEEINEENTWLPRRIP